MRTSAAACLLILALVSSPAAAESLQLKRSVTVEPPDGTQLSTLGSDRFVAAGMGVPSGSPRDLPTYRTHFPVIDVADGTVIDLQVPTGALLAGPAPQPLAAYPISFDGTRILTIEIPGLGFVVNMTSVVNATNQTRLQLRFPTVSGVRYDVQFRAALTDGAWTRIPFSTAVDTAPALMTLTGNNTQATVFVEPSSASGFYAIGRGVPV